MEHLELYPKKEKVEEEEIPQKVEADNNQKKDEGIRKNEGKAQGGREDQQHGKNNEEFKEQKNKKGGW